MRTLPWPEMQSKLTPAQTIRALLDYIHWICREMRQIGFHAGTDRDEWCQRVQRAYSSLFIPIYPGHGDPYPPDVPPARNPGIWPDIPAASISGMTLRHQLSVMEMLARNLRETPWPHARAQEVADWDRRLNMAYEALDHGEAMPLPEDAQTEASKEAIAAADAAAKALRDRARRRSRQLRQQMQQRAQAAKQSKMSTAKAATEPKKTPPPKKAAAVKKKTAKKKTAKKAAKKTAARKTAAKKTTAKKKAKAAKKTTAKKKAKAAKKTTAKKAAKKKTAKRKTTRKR